MANISEASRLLAEVYNEMRCRAAANRFGVASSTPIRWHALRRDEGEFGAESKGGDM